MITAKENITATTNDINQRDIKYIVDPFLMKHPECVSQCAFEDRVLLKYPLQKHHRLA